MKMEVNFFSVEEVCKLVPALPKHEQKQKLFQLMINPEHFDVLVKEVKDLTDLASAFPELEYKKELFNFLKQNFERLVKNVASFIKLVSVFPEYKEHLLDLLIEESNFERLVKTKEDRDNLISIFPRLSSDKAMEMIKIFATGEPYSLFSSSPRLLTPEGVRWPSSSQGSSFTLNSTGNS